MNKRNEKKKKLAVVQSGCEVRCVEARPPICCFGVPSVDQGEGLGRGLGEELGRGLGRGWGGVWGEGTKGVGGVCGGGVAGTGREGVPGGGGAGVGTCG